MQLIATRIYDQDEIPCVDRIYRKGNSFALHQTGGGEPEAWEIITPAYVGQWLSEGPEQIVYVGW